MPRFTPPTRPLAMDHPFWGRFQIEEGQTVIRAGSAFVLLPGPTTDELTGLVEGEDYWRGGYVYYVTDEVGEELASGGYDVEMDDGYGAGAYGDDEYGDE